MNNRRLITKRTVVASGSSTLHDRPTTHGDVAVGSSWDVGRGGHGIARRVGGVVPTVVGVELPAVMRATPTKE